MNKRKLGFFLWLIIFIAAFTLLAYGTLEIWQTQRSITNGLDEWDKQHLSLKSLEGLTSEAVDENLQITTEQEQLPIFTDPLKSVSSSLIPANGEVIGKITLDRLHKSYPIIEGTDNAQLAKGVGHYKASVFPGEKGNSVLAGHRDSVFRKLGELEPNDLITFETKAGSFTYSVTGSKIVEVDDTSVFLSGDESTITLITCYPFHFVGNAPKRYLLFAKKLPMQ
ncbi:sortase [Paenibacillus psychroresistens]|nr:sortase [Paenibacillus psychroresistens]